MSRSLLSVPALAGVLLLTACSVPGLPGGGGGGSLEGFPDGVDAFLIEGTTTSQTFWDDEGGYGWIYVSPSSGAEPAELAEEVEAAFDGAGLAVVSSVADSEFATGVPYVPTRVGEGFIVQAWGGDTSGTPDGRPGVSYNLTATGLPADAFTEHDDVITAIAPHSSLAAYGEYWTRYYFSSHPDAVESDCNALLLEADAALKAGGLQPDEVIDPTWLGPYESYRYGDIELSCAEPWGSMTGESGWLVQFAIEIPKA